MDAEDEENRYHNKKQFTGKARGRSTYIVIHQNKKTSKQNYSGRQNIKFDDVVELTCDVTKVATSPLVA